MQAFDPTYALGAAVIWAFSPIYYRAFMKRFDFLSLNFVRTSLSAAVLAIPAALYWTPQGASFALFSGVVTLALGDSLFLLAVREVGASVATPVVYTYVFLVQVTAGLLGETVPGANFVSAAMVLAGVAALSRGKSGSGSRGKGIALGLGAAAIWAVGQDAIGLATEAGGSVVAIAFMRNLAAAAALGIVLVLTGGREKWPKGLGMREFAVVAAVSVTDLVVGSVLYVKSVSAAGIALTVILTSLSPLLTQLISKATGKESPSFKDILGGVLIVGALVLAVLG